MCTLENEPQRSICGVCGTKRPPQPVLQNWNCVFCTMENRGDLKVCSICQSPRDAPPPSPQQQQQQQSPAGLKRQESLSGHPSVVESRLSSLAELQALEEQKQQQLLAAQTEQRRLAALETQKQQKEREAERLRQIYLNSNRELEAAEAKETVTPVLKQAGQAAMKQRKDPRSQALSIAEGYDVAQSLQVLRLLQKVFGNILAEPSNERFRQLNLGKERVRELLVRPRAVSALLISVGFREHKTQDAHLWVLPEASFTKAQRGFLGLHTLISQLVRELETSVPEIFNKWRDAQLAWRKVRREQHRQQQRKKTAHSQSDDEDDAKMVDDESGDEDAEAEAVKDGVAKLRVVDEPHGGKSGLKSLPNWRVDELEFFCLQYLERFCSSLQANLDVQDARRIDVGSPSFQLRLKRLPPVRVVLERVLGAQAEMEGDTCLVVGKGPQERNYLSEGRFLQAIAYALQILIQDRRPGLPLVKLVEALQATPEESRSKFFALVDKAMHKIKQEYHVAKWRRLKLAPFARLVGEPVARQLFKALGFLPRPGEPGVLYLPTPGDLLNAPGSFKRDQVSDVELFEFRVTLLSSAYGDKFLQDIHLL